jgi:hypothetical protein
MAPVSAKTLNMLVYPGVCGWTFEAGSFVSQRHSTEAEAMEALAQWLRGRANTLRDAGV